MPLMVYLAQPHGMSLSPRCGRGSACMRPSIKASPVVRMCSAAYLCGGSRLRSLSLERSWEGCGLFAMQIRQPSQERCFATEKQWNTLFHRTSGRCGMVSPHLPLFLLPHEDWCWKQRSERNRSGEALALAFAPGFQPLPVLYNHRNPGATAIGRMIRSRSGLSTLSTHQPSHLLP
jgi:hypothetical protein